VNCFILACEQTREGIIVDPGENVPDILDLVREDDIQVVEVVATHGHVDHIARAASVIRETGAPFAIHREDVFLVENLADVAAAFGLETDLPPQIDRTIDEGDTVRFGGETLEILHTPGHAPGNIALTWPGHAVVGDTLFAGSIGRTDLPGGNMEALMRSIREKLLPLGDETHIYPGHGPFTTIGVERKTNPFLAGDATVL
jgi:glyoxylase-like metal-dependent hydrolase (beta-lactamase superfamily II)